MSVRNEIKAQIIRAGFTMQETNYKMSSPKMKIVQKNAPPLTNSIQMLRKTSEGDGESKTTKPEYALVFKNCSI